jgi:hypothetical protein
LLCKTIILSMKNDPNGTRLGPKRPNAGPPPGGGKAESIDFDQVDLRLQAVPLRTSPRLSRGGACRLHSPVEARTRLAVLDSTIKGRPYRRHRPGHGKTWRPQATSTLFRLTSPSQQPVRPGQRRHQPLVTVLPIVAVSAGQTNPRLGVQGRPQESTRTVATLPLVADSAASEAPTS